MVNFKFDTIFSLLSPNYSNVDAYQAAQFVFEMNKMNAFSSLLSKYVSMSLLSDISLEQVLTVVDDSQEKLDNRIMWAIRKHKLPANYGSRLFLDALTLAARWPSEDNGNTISITTNSIHSLGSNIGTSTPNQRRYGN